MRARPLFVLGIVATCMVTWFVVRMWAPEMSGVWQVSCTLGAWAPLAAAVIFRYIQFFGDREDGVLAAWLVRAIGMHCVLVWLIGISDFLRGPPGSPPAWNADLGMPLVFLAFAPVFAVSLALVRWLLAVAHRLGDVAPSVTRTRAVEAGGAPYRDASRRAESISARAPALALSLSVAAGSAAVGAALFSSTSPLYLLGGSAFALSLASIVGRRAVLPSVVTLVAVAGIALFREPAATLAHAVHKVMVWPCLVVVAVGLYLAPLEVRLRLRGLRAAR